MKKTWLGAMVFLAAILLCGVWAQAVEDVEMDLSDGSIVVTQEGDETVFTQNGTETRSGEAFALIEQTGSSATAKTITVKSGDVELMINSLKISSSSHCIDVQAGAKLTLTLVGKSTLTSSQGCGIHVPEGAELTVESAGSGEVVSKGGNGSAGIGGKGIYWGYIGGNYTFFKETAGTIVINEGKITATGGNNGHGGGAGIGSGSVGDGGTIIINGGIIVATGGERSTHAMQGGAGIGSGAGDSEMRNTIIGTIIINDGTVTATGGTDGAGIGGGDSCIRGSISILGGTVTATGRNGGAGIGGGCSGEGGIINISGGTVTAIGGNGGDYGAAGIGGGEGGAGGTIAISDATVNATGGGDYSGGPGIGAGTNGSGGTVSVVRSDLTAYGKVHAIGSGLRENRYGLDKITIDSKTKRTLSHDFSEGADCQERIDNLTLSDAGAQTGQEVTFKTTAKGASGVTFQWEGSKNKQTWTTLTGETSRTLKVTCDPDGNQYFRCKVTNGWGNIVYTGIARLWNVEFTTQPQDTAAALDKRAVFEAAVNYSAAALQWEKSYDGGETWTPIENQDSGSLIVKAELQEATTLYRCVAAVGDSQILSDTARLTITDSPVYATRYYMADLDGTYQMVSHGIDGRVITRAAAGDTVQAAAKTFDHYKLNTKRSAAGGVQDAGSELVLSCYYDRETYKVYFRNWDGEGGVQTEKVKYGGTAAPPADIPAREHYTFGGWYLDKAFTRPYDKDAPVEKTMNVYARWTPDAPILEEITREEITVTVQIAVPEPAAEPEAVIAWCAVYDEHGRMLEARRQEITEDTRVSFAFDSAAFTSAAAFLLDGGGEPLCGSISGQ